MSDTIKEKLSKIKELNNDVYDILIHDKLEFNRLERFKKGTKQSLRKYKAGGLRAVFDNLSAKKIIDKINSPSNKKKILYITITPSFNLLRQSIYMRKNENYETILLMESPWLLKLMEKHFDAVYIYDTYYELANILNEIKPYIIHVQGSMLGSDFLCMLAKLLSSSKIVFEFYDVPSLTINMEDSISAWGKKNTELGFFAEQFACENADGIILGYSREAAEILKKQYNIKAQILEFHTYVCNEFLTNGNKTKFSQKDGKIHLVYGGYVYTANIPKNVNDSYQFVELIKEITRQGIYLDIYTSPHISAIKFEQLFADYIALSKENNLFRFMKGFPPHEAVNEFSQYDFGMLHLFDHGSFLNKSNKIRLPGKFFFYLEAGLPILISEEFEYGSKLVREHEIGIVVSQKDIYNLSQIIPLYDYEKLRKNVITAREKFSMETHIDKLIGFYEEINNKNIL
ncbi:MAG: Beta-1,6-galactofuranosyltransferase [Candidatus Brocadiaceae bacterium]|nr:Beta-1,6-galactofuranosyltransferase [Candidatus Brocadiaceae bacterium]